MSREFRFVEDNIYHIYNRGVRKLDIFLNEKDYYRWMDLMRWYLRCGYSYSKFLERVQQVKKFGGDVSRIETEISNLYGWEKPPIEVLAWVLMPNHFHLVAKQIIEDGISIFLHRIANAYVHYFNLKHNVSGSLFQGRFKAVEVETDEQLIHLCRYVHANPVVAGLVERENLSEYPWSSLRSYLLDGDDRITNKETLMEYFGSKNGLKEFTLAPFEEVETEIISELIYKAT